MKARARLVSGNLRYIYQAAHVYHAQEKSLDVDDLASEGALGLLHAVPKFDFSVGVTFLTYAGQWVHQAMQRAVARYRSKLGGMLYTLDGSGRSVVGYMERIIGSGSSISDAAEHAAEVYGLTVERTRMLYALRHVRIASFDAPVDLYDEGSATIGERVAGPGQTPEAEAMVSECKAVVRAVAAELDLSPRSRLVLERRLLSETPATLDEIGGWLGVTRERARQIESRVIERLRSRLKNHKALRELLG